MNHSIPPVHDRTIPVVHSTSVWLPRTQTWMYNQALCLAAPFEPHIVCERTDNLSEFRLPNIHSLSDEPPLRRFIDRGFRKLGVRTHLDYLAAVVRETGSRLVHSHFGGHAWRNISAVRMTDARHVVSFYGADVTQAPRSESSNRKRYRQLFDQVEGVFCEGRVMARRILELGCPAEKIVVHHLGVRVDEFPFQPRSWRPGEPFRVLISATFREKKGIPYAIRALGALRDSVDLEITVMGGATGKPGDAEEKSRILAAIQETGLGDKVRMPGFQPHSVLLEEAYRHHVFLSPSVTARDGDAEGGAPVSIIEMAATGMPVVSTFHCDIPEVVLDGTTGWLAPERDWEALASHLRWLVEHPEGWAGYLEAGRKHVEKEYRCRTQGERLASEYLRIIGDLR